MSINIDALFQHLMEDPDIIPPEGEEKEDIAMAMATQRAKQSNNNIKALNMAGEDRTISKLLAFLKAEGDTDEDKKFREDYYKHQRNFETHGKKIEDAAKKGNEYEWPKIKAGDIEGDERVGETSYAGKVQKKEWEDAYDFLTQHTPGMVDQHEQRIAMATVGGQEAEGDDVEAEGEGEEVQAPASASATKKRVGPTTGAAVSDEEKAQIAQEMRDIGAAREEGAGMSLEERRADAKARAADAKEEEDNQADREAVARAKVQDKLEDIDSGDESDDEATYGQDPKNHPFYHGKFGDTPAKQQAFAHLEANYSLPFLEAAHDWHTRQPGDRGIEGGDDLPGKGGSTNPYFHHDGGKPEAEIDPKAVEKMALSYQEALEDKGKEAAKAEGEPLEVSEPAGKKTLAEWSGKATNRQDQYEDDMDSLLHRFLDGYAHPDTSMTPKAKGARNRERGKNPDAAQDFDNMREAWDTLGLQGKLDSKEIDDDEYYEGLDKFIQENRTTLNKHYKDPKKLIGANRVPKRPKELPDEDTQDNIIEIGTADNAAEELPKAVEEESNKIASGKGSTGKKKTKTKELNEFVETVAEEKKIEIKPPDVDTSDENIVRTTAQNVASGDQDPKDLEDAGEVVGENAAEKIIDQHEVSESDKPMSNAAKKFFTSHDIDPESPGVAHVKNIKDAREHVGTREVESEEVKVPEIAIGEPEAGAEPSDTMSREDFIDFVAGGAGEAGGTEGRGRRKALDDIQKTYNNEYDIEAFADLASAVNKGNFAKHTFTDVDGNETTAEQALMNIQKKKTAFTNAMDHAKELMDNPALELDSEIVNRTFGKDGLALPPTKDAEGNWESLKPNPDSGRSQADLQAVLDNPTDHLTAPSVGDEEVPPDVKITSEDEAPKSAVEELTARQKEPKPGQQPLPEGRRSRRELTAQPSRIGRERAGEDTPEREPEGEQRSFEDYKEDLERLTEEDRAKEEAKAEPTNQSSHYRHQLANTEDRKEMAERINADKEEKGRELTAEEKAAIHDEIYDKRTDTNKEYEALREDHVKRVHETAAATRKVKADQQREHDNLVNRIRGSKWEDKEARVADLHAMGERHNPDGGGDAAVKQALEDLEAIDERDPEDPSGAANNRAMHIALGGTPKIAVQDLPPYQQMSHEELGNRVVRSFQMDALKQVLSDGNQEYFDKLSSEDQDKIAKRNAENEATPGKNEPGIKARLKDGLNWMVEKLGKLGTKQMSKGDQKVDDFLTQNGLNHRELTSRERSLKFVEDNVGVLPNYDDGEILTEEDLAMIQSKVDEQKQNIEQHHKDNEEVLSSPEYHAFHEKGASYFKENSSYELPEPMGTPSGEPATSGEDALDVSEYSDEEVTPTEETPEETTTAEPEPESTEERQIEVTTTEGEPEAEEADPEPVADAAPARRERTPAGVTGTDQQIPFDRRRMRTDPTLEERVEGSRRPGEPGVGTRTPAPGPTTEQRADQTSRLGDATTLQEKENFLLENKMSPEVLRDLSDDEIHEEYGKQHKKLSDKAMSDHVAGKVNKEDVLAAMAKASGEDLEELREKHQFDTPEDLVKTHKAAEKERADNKHEHEKSEAISDALGMEELPEGADKLDAIDRARDIAKKMNANKMAVDKGGKPILDSNASSHLKELLSDAVDKGDLSDEDIKGIADDAFSRGDKFLDDDHKAEISADNDRQRAHHEEFLDHAEGTSEAALKRRGHDLDHSKGHELHEYSTNDDGTVGERTGATHSQRKEDGSIEHVGGPDVPESVDGAVDGMEAEHPPKLLGLDKDGQADQKEHFDLMKKAAAGNLEPGDFENFKALEAKNPELASPKYKGQVLGAVRQQLSGEGGADKMNDMGLSEDQHDETMESGCRPPAGAMPTGVGKAWNPDTHRWCDKEYLDEIKGQLGPGEASYHPEGIHAGAVDKDGNPLDHLDQDADGNVQAAMVTPTGVHKVNPSTGDMKTADGGHVNHADVLGHHLKDHEGGKVDKDTLHAMGMNHSDKHTSEGQRGALGQAFQETPGMRMAKPVLGKLGQMLQRNKDREKGKPNATATDRQRARRDTDGSPLRDVLSKIGTHTAESLKDAAEELPGYLGGGIARDTDRHRDKQTRKAVKKVRQRDSASQKLTDSINRVMEEDAV